MSSKLTFSVSKNKIVVLTTAALMFVGGTAFGLGAINTPAGGYLLCVNKSNKTVTFPGVLRCPSGTTSLILGARGVAGAPGVDGAEGLAGASGPVGAQGPAGPVGPAGSSASSVEWSYFLTPMDLVGPSGASDYAGLKKTILATITPSNLHGGVRYILRADLRGSWSSSTGSGSFINCYFQSASDYPNGATYYGSSSTTFRSWTTLDLHVWAEPSDYSIGQSNLYLVCATNGVISGLTGLITATGYQSVNLITPVTTPSV